MRRGTHPSANDLFSIHYAADGKVFTEPGAGRTIQNRFDRAAVRALMREQDARFLSPGPSRLVKINNPA